MQNVKDGLLLHLVLSARYNDLGEIHTIWFQFLSNILLRNAYFNYHLLSHLESRRTGKAQLPSYCLPLCHAEAFFVWCPWHLCQAYCHPTYLSSMQRTLCEMPGWMKLQMESRFSGEISITSDMQMTTS